MLRIRSTPSSPPIPLTVGGFFNDRPFWHFPFAKESPYSATLQYCRNSSDHEAIIGDGFWAIVSSGPNVEECDDNLSTKHCPTPRCTGAGNLNRRHATHSSALSCPLAGGFPPRGVRRIKSPRKVSFHFHNRNQADGSAHNEQTSLPGRRGIDGRICRRSVECPGGKRGLVVLDMPAEEAAAGDDASFPPLGVWTRGRPWFAYFYLRASSEGNDLLPIRSRSHQGLSCP